MARQGPSNRFSWTCLHFNKFFHAQSTLTYFGKIPAEALRQAQLAKKAWLEAARAEGKPIPRPKYRPAIYKVSS
jgi:hypothetical protein